MKKYDIAIIGGGAGGFAAAIRAEELGAKAVMINSGLPLGGTCVNVGCVPSKTLLYAGEILHMATHHGVGGIELAVKSFDYSKVIKDEIALVEQMRQEKYRKVLESLASTEFIDGRARFISPHELEVNGETITADKVIIATGSTARVPAIEGIEDTGYITHIEALKLKKLPEGLIVIGAGPVGLEFAQMFSRFDSKVTVLKRTPSIFPRSEDNVVEQLVNVLEGEGIEFRLGVKFISAKMDGDKKVLTYTMDGKTEKVVGDEILLAAGKIPNTDGLNLEQAGVETDSSRAIVVSKSFQTSASHIYAAGDVAALPMRLEITAGNEGSRAAENALTDSELSIDYDTVPYTIFTDPQLAGVGITEAESMRRTGSCLCRTVSFEAVPKAIIINRTEGMVKMVIDPETKVILGVHILSPQAGELAAWAVTLVKNKNTIFDVLDTLPMFPTLAESIKLVAMSFVRDISKMSCCT
jgi:mercuric reductase